MLTEKRNVRQPRTPCARLHISRTALSRYGSLEKTLCAIRDHRPLDLNAGQWRPAHPRGAFKTWQKQARACLREGLHYDPGPLNLRAKVHKRVDRGAFTLEHVSFNTTPWNRINGFFLLPKNAQHPLPALVVFHEWGGPMLFGKERVVNTGRDHPALIEHRATVSSGRYLADFFADAGYAVIVIDAHHFGERVPKGLNGIPEEFDPFSLDNRSFARLDGLVREQLYLGVRQLNWAGTTWMGVNFWDDSRCIDYLLSRPEVDRKRIGCTGLSGGGWRTNVLAALDPRVRAAVPVGWMTTGDYQQVYNVSGAIGTFCLLPGVWRRLDVPDLIAMAAPAACMVISGKRDLLFPPEGQKAAARQIQAAFRWAGCPRNFRHLYADKPHCYDAELQTEALKWFDRHLR